MPSGKVKTKEEVAEILASMANTSNLHETSRQLNVPVNTVKKIFDENRYDEDYKDLQQSVKMNFAKKATSVIDKGMQLLDMRLTTALEHQEEMTNLLIQFRNDEELSAAQKKSIVAKINKLQINSLSELTTAIGTIYDKRDRATGEDPESNVKVTIIDDL